MKAVDIDSAIALIAILFVAVMAIRGWRSGTLGGILLLSTTAAGIAAGVWAYHNGVSVLSEYVGVEFSAFWSTVAAGVMAIIGFVVGRMITRTIIQSTFGPEGPLNAWLRGPSGALISLIPSIVIIAVVCYAIRWAGTNYELFQIDRVSQAPADFVGGEYPSHSPLTDWRDAIERWPYSTEVLDQLAPATSIPRRNLAAYLMASANSGTLRSSLRKDPDLSTVAKHPTVEALENHPDLQALIDGRSGAVLKYKTLLGHKLLRDAMKDEQLRARLNLVDVPHAIEEEVSKQKKPKQQSWLESIFSRQ